MKKLLTYLLFMLLSASSFAQPVWTWAQGMGGYNNNQFSMDVDVDPNGYTYVVGDFSGTRNFGTVSLTATSPTQMFVAKIDAAGNTVWAVKLGAYLNNCITAGLVYNDGAIYVAGKFYTNLDVDTITIYGTGQTDIFLAKLDTATGGCYFLHGIGGPYQDRPIAMDRAIGGGVVLAGTYTGTVPFGNDTLTTPSIINTYSFITRVLDDGTISWAKSISSSNTIETNSIAQSRNGSIAVTGGFVSNVSFGPSTNLNSSVNADIFVAKYDSSGNALWAKSGGGNGNDSGQGVGLDDQGAVYLAGNISGNSTFGTVTLTDNGGGNIAIVKYSPTGTPLWGRSEGGSSFDNASKISTDHLGSSYVTGGFTGNATFSGNSLSGTNDVFIAKYDPNGVIRWVMKAGGSTNYDQGSAIEADSSGYCVFGGTFYGTGTFGTFSFAAPANEWGSFAAKISGGTVGINEAVAIDGIAIFPNPVQSLLTIRSDKDAAIESIRIFSAEGKLVYEENPSQIFFRQIDLNTIAAGMYHVALGTNKGQINRTISVQ